MRQDCRSDDRVAIGHPRIVGLLALACLVSSLLPFSESRWSDGAGRPLQFLTRTWLTGIPGDQEVVRPWTARWLEMACEPCRGCLEGPYWLRHETLWHLVAYQRRPAAVFALVVVILPLALCLARRSTSRRRARLGLSAVALVLFAIAPWFLVAELWTQAIQVRPLVGSRVFLASLGGLIASLGWDVWGLARARPVARDAVVEGNDERPSRPLDGGGDAKA